MQYTGVNWDTVQSAAMVSFVLGIWGWLLMFCIIQDYKDSKKKKD